MSEPQLVEGSALDELASLVADLRATVEWDRLGGARALPRTGSLLPEPDAAAGGRAARAAPAPRPAPPPPKTVPAPTLQTEKASPPARVVVPPKPAPSSLPAAWAQWTERAATDGKGAEVEGRLAELNREIAACRACGRCETRKQALAGEGKVVSGLMVVTTEPGEAEDRSGHHLRGPAGEMLDRMLENVLGLRRDQIYATSLLRCRPPAKETAELRSGSLRACRAFLQREVEILEPRVIMALGVLPTRALIEGGAEPGTWHAVGRAAVMPTFDLAHLLAKPADKRLAMTHLLAVSARLKAAV